MHKMFGEIETFARQLNIANAVAGTSPVVQMPQICLFIKPKALLEDKGYSVESFIGHVELYLCQVPGELKLAVSASFFRRRYLHVVYSYISSLHMGLKVGGI